MLQLHLHGPPRATLPNGACVPLSAREAALLARLHLDGPAPRAVLAAWLWPGGNETRARANLRQTLLRLKRALGAPLAEADAVLSLAAAVSVPPAPGRLLGTLEFDDAPDLAEWLAERRARAQRDRLREGLRAADELLRQGKLHAALARADQVLADDPAVEEAHRLRMQVFLARGDRAAAITAWDDCRDALRAAYGIQPSALTNDLGRRILAAAAQSMPPLPGEAAAPAPPASVTASPRLQGRQAALQVIAEAGAAQHAVVVSGAGGMGKSRLLEAALATLPGSVWVAGRPGDEHLPGVLVSRLVVAVLAQTAPDLDAATRRDLQQLLPRRAGDGDALPPLASARDHRRVLGAVQRTLRAAHGQGLRHLVVDDLQFADDLSVEALAVVVGDWLADPGGAVARPWFGCRADELRPAAERLLALLRGTRRCVHIALAPLGVDDIAALLGDLPPHPAAPDPATHRALAAALHERVGGNPAFVLEALRCLAQAWPAQADAGGSGAAWQPGQPLPLPANLLDALHQRLAGLPEEALRLAQLAAVAGTDFSLGLAATALGRAPLALAPLFARLEAAQVLAGTGFVHDLVADAVSRSLPEALRGPLHALVADHLEAHGGAASAIARHRWAAGDRPAAAAWFERAAAHARARWQMAAAAEAFAGAAQALPQDDPAGRRLTAWRDSARCWLNAGDAARAAAALDHAAALARDEREQLQVQAARLTLCLNTGRHGALASTARWLAEALPRHEAALDDDELAHTLLGVATAAPYVPDPDALLALVDGLQPRAARSPRLAARIELAAGMVLNWQARPREALQRLLQGDRLAVDHQLGGERVNLGNQLARSEEQLGDLAAASRRCLATCRIARELGVGAIFEADLLNLQGLYEAVLGRHERARQAFAEAERLLGPAGQRSGYMLVRQAVGLCHLGEVDAATELLQAVPEPAGDDAHGVFSAFRAWAGVELEAAQGRPVDAWLARAERSCEHGPRLLTLRQAVLRACHRPGAAAERQALLQTLVGDGLAGLAAALRAPGADHAPGDRPTTVGGPAGAAGDAAPDPWSALSARQRPGG